MKRDCIVLEDETIYHDELIFYVANPPTIRITRKNVGLPMDLGDSKLFETLNKTVAHDFKMRGAKLVKYKN